MINGNDAFENAAFRAMFTKKQMPECIGGLIQPLHLVNVPKKEDVVFGGSSFLSTGLREVAVPIGCSFYGDDFLCSFEDVSPADVVRVRLLRDLIGIGELERHPIHVSGDVALLRQLQCYGNDVDKAYAEFLKVAKRRDDMREALRVFEAWIMSNNGCNDGGVSFETIPGVAELTKQSPLLLV